MFCQRTCSTTHVAFELASQIQRLIRVVRLQKVQQVFHNDVRIVIRLQKKVGTF